MILPHIIAICGNPTSGKSEVQRILATKGVYPIDDGEPLRRFAVDSLGLLPADVRTQEGKLRATAILDRDWEHRKLLGEFGKKLEELFGPDIMPFMATRKLDPNVSYSFGCVRRKQGWFYKRLGGVVLGIERPGVKPSGNDFDEFDKTAVDHWIPNTGSLQDLHESVIHTLQAVAKHRPELAFVR